MTYTQAQIDKANAVDLEKFLRAQGETLVRSGKEYRWKAHDSLTVCGNKWFRHSQSKGGLPVDFVMEFYGKSFPEAVQMLTGEPGEAQPEAGPAPSPAFRLPLRNVTNANILNYLTQERKLSPSLVNFFIAAGDIYEDAAHHNVVFVGRDADGHPHYASSRGIREKFRQDAAGAEKAFGFAHRGTDKQLLVFEATIDLLSFIELFPKNWQQHNYLSLGGVSGKALRQFLSERPDVERVFLCLDADKAGEDACKRLAALLPDTVSVTRIQPCMKDWNDVLVHRAEIPNRNYFKSIVLKEPSKPETVKIIRMSDVELTPVEWLWKPYLPFGKLSVLQGNPGEGKTYFAMHLAAACTNGKLVATIRSREISACLVLQTRSQLKAIYKDNADTIVGNMDSQIFLGGSEPTTLKDLSEMLGKETIDAFNTSDTRGNSPSYGTTFQKMGHELLSRDELAVLDGGKCILQLRGVRPFLSDKYDLTQHPNYKLTSDYDPKNTFDIEKYLNRKTKIHPGDEFIVVDADSLPSA